MWSQLEHFLGTAVGKSPGMSFTDSFVAADRPEPKAVSREAWRKMVMIFADHLRDQKQGKTFEKRWPFAFLWTTRATWLMQLLNFEVLIILQYLYTYLWAPNQQVPGETCLTKRPWRTARSSEQHSCTLLFFQARP